MLMGSMIIVLFAAMRAGSEEMPAGQSPDGSYWLTAQVLLAPSLDSAPPDGTFVDIVWTDEDTFEEAPRVVAKHVVLVRSEIIDSSETDGGRTRLEVVVQATSGDDIAALVAAGLGAKRGYGTILLRISE
jgi:hypothetical protein